MPSPDSTIIFEFFFQTDCPNVSVINFFLNRCVPCIAEQKTPSSRNTHVAGPTS